MLQEAFWQPAHMRYVMQADPKQHNQESSAGPGQKAHVIEALESHMNAVTVRNECEAGLPVANVDHQSLAGMKPSAVNSLRQTTFRLARFWYTELPRCYYCKTEICQVSIYNCSTAECRYLICTCFVKSADF